MSIINDTLSRLEQERLLQGGPPDGKRPGLPVHSPRRLPVKVLASAVLLVFAGTGLAVLQWNDRSGTAGGLAVAGAGGRTTGAEEADHTQPPGPLAERALPASPEVPQVPATGTEAGAARVALPPRAAAAPPETGRPQVDTGVSSVDADAPRLSAVDVQAGPQRGADARPGAAPAGADEESGAAGESFGEPAGAAAVAESHRAREAADGGPGLERAAAPSAEPRVSEPQEVVGRTGRETPAERTAVVAVTDPGEAQPPAGRQVGQSIQRAAEPGPAGKSVATAASKSAGGEAARAASGPASAAQEKEPRAPQGPAAAQADQHRAVDETVDGARVALAREQYGEALAALEALSPVPRDRADFWLIKGSAHLGLGQLDDAEQAFASAHALVPGNAQVAVQRAILKQERADHAGALQILKAAAERHPDVPEVFLNLGYSQQELGAVREARRSFAVFLSRTEGRSLYAEQRRAVNQWLAQFAPTSR